MRKQRAIWTVYNSDDGDQGCQRIVAITLRSILQPPLHLMFSALLPLIVLVLLPRLLSNDLGIFLLLALKLFLGLVLRLNLGWLGGLRKARGWDDFSFGRHGKW